MLERGTIVDANVHLWDNTRNPVFWLEDRSLVRDLIGNYDSLPDVYTLRDYQRETASFNVRGIVWSDAGAADPVAAAEWVSSQDPDRALITGLVSLGDPGTDGFGDLLDGLRRIPLVHSVRVRLAAGLAQGGDKHGGESEVPFLERPLVMNHFRLMASRSLVATIEATSDQIPVVARLADDVPDLRIVIDHLGWPTDLTDHGRDRHLERLGELAARTNVATRLDALGTIFGSWNTGQVQPWLVSVVDLSAQIGAWSVPTSPSNGYARRSYGSTRPTTRSSPVTQPTTGSSFSAGPLKSGTEGAESRRRWSAARLRLVVRKANTDHPRRP